MSNLNREEIIKLVKDGFPLDLISFEFNIPLDTLKEYKQYIDSKEIENKNKVNTKNNKAVQKKEEYRPDNNVNEIYSQIHKMRQRYYDLKSGNNSLKTIHNEDNALIEKVIQNVDNYIKSIDTEKMNIQKIYDNLKKSYKELEKISTKNLSIEQVEILDNIFNNENLKAIKREECVVLIKRIKSTIQTKLYSAISAEVPRLNDIEELERLKTKIISQNRKTQYLGITNVKSSIDNRIAKLKRRTAIR